MVTRILTIFIAAMLGMPALGQAPDTGGYAKSLFGRLYPEDQSLAKGWETGLQALLDELKDSSEDQETLDAIPEFERLIEAEHLAFSIEELDGSWRMRSLQATDYGAFIYQYFPARIYPEAQAMVFDKNSGSQRHRGLMAQLDAETVFFVGALYYGYEDPRIYSAMTPGEVTEEQREFDAVAEIYKIGDNHFLMAFAPSANRFRLYEIRK
ncbi:DUF4893 domain-containing protein [Pelagibacterium flavum]|uniref:DUF4893 domain-containing protein n=1 Tax=Pelagibacterium flavum TaxID=2984530 RepID=A0ABY6IQX9_9HYPH|nr:DUF4893 domain-containing protein [Pelagibacterium sp. YIM 151497]UYQ72125.1 DUF4893 domain-containing protein [Pelagibacterium sp. YIM 151497]|tara:strand:+ start:1160 stop:1789 length:630 start_codon:yes stop_codon:yes gene_type:complete